MNRFGDALPFGWPSIDTDAVEAYIWIPAGQAIQRQVPQRMSAATQQDLFDFRIQDRELGEVPWLHQMILK